MDRLLTFHFFDGHNRHSNLNYHRHNSAIQDQSTYQVGNHPPYILITSN